jgi:hypothetical protein
MRTARRSRSDLNWQGRCACPWPGSAPCVWPFNPPSRCSVLRTQWPPEIVAVRRAHASKCSADWKSAGSRIGNPQGEKKNGVSGFPKALPNAIRRARTVPLCATQPNHCPSHRISSGFRCVSPSALWPCASTLDRPVRSPKIPSHHRGANRCRRLPAQRLRVLRGSATEP